MCIAFLCSLLPSVHSERERERAAYGMFAQTVLHPIRFLIRLALFVFSKITNEWK